MKVLSVTHHPHEPGQRQGISARNGDKSKFQDRFLVRDVVPGEFRNRHHTPRSRRIELGVNIHDKTRDWINFKNLCLATSP